MKIFNDDMILARQKRASVNLDSVISAKDAVVIFSGEPIQKPGGLDQTYPFLPHPDYFWITGIRRFSGVATYSKNSGWVSFVKPLSDEERVWEGSNEEAYGKNISEFDTWLAQNKFDRVFVLGQPTVKNSSLSKESGGTLHLDVQESFNRARRIKDAAEIALVKDIAQMAAKGYAILPKIIKPGISERQIQLEYENEVLRNGSEKFPYDTIVGSGVNSAVLHAIPTAKIVKDGEMVLIDAGADLYDYCVDITRVYAANGKFSEQQKFIFDTVLKAQKAALDTCRAGVAWSDVHTASAKVIAEGLRQMNLIKGEADNALETGAVSLFYPHGVGHMVGLKVRDVGGPAGGTPKMCCGIKLRADLTMEENFMMTVEPGFYFIKPLLENPQLRSKYGNQVNWAEAEKWLHVGGVRLEDDIVITKTGHENLTSFIAK